MSNSPRQDVAAAWVLPQATHSVDSERPARLIGAVPATSDDDGTNEIDLANGSLAEMQAQERERRYREVLLHANRISTLGQISASIAHQINQPVAATVTNAQAALRFLEGPQPDLQEVRRSLTRIAQLGNRIVEIVGCIRALVQRGPPRRDDFEVNDAIRETISLTQEELVKHAVSVHTRFAFALPLVRADRVQLQQVVLNLIMNAVEAMRAVPQGPRELSISTGQTNSGDVLVAVEDCGPGLDAQNLEFVFRPFYSTKPDGLGIGLSICRSIIEAHAGQLWAIPREPHGATFQFTLPVHLDRVSPESGRTDCVTGARRTS